MKVLKKNNAITLIALVITIIVLLILAGVSLSLIAGENGILKRATNAVDVNEKATAEEQANLLLADIAMQYYEERYVNNKENLGTLDEYIQTQLGSGKATSSGDYTVKMSDGKIVVSKDGKEISSGTMENGNVSWPSTSTGNTTKPEGQEINAATVANDPTTYYGAQITNYMNSSDYGWKIFHSDGNNIYLITDNYIPYSSLPKVNDDVALPKGATDYNAYWDDNVIDTLAMLDGSAIQNRGTDVHYVNEYMNYYLGEVTLELFVDSYNKTHASRKINVSSDGKLKWSDETEYSTYITGLDTNESLYVISDMGRAEWTWVASLEYMNNFYTISGDTLIVCDSSSRGDQNGGFRRVVKLDSNVKLEKQPNGNYQIQ